MVTVAGRELVVAAPPGYCFDKDATRHAPQASFVQLAGCPARSGGTQAPGILTATIAPAGPGAEPVASSAASLDAYVRSEAGRRALSRAGDPAHVEILETFHNEGVFYLHMSDTSPDPEADLTPKLWRAFLDLPGSIAQISVMSPRTTPMEPDQGVRTLRHFATMMRARNGVTSTSPVAEIDELEIVEDYTGTKAYEHGEDDDGFTPAPAATPRTRPAQVDPLRALWAIGILRRLL